MLFHDAVANAQAQAGAFADAFCGEEWIKNSLRIADSLAIVTERHFYKVLVAGSRNFNARTFRVFPHSIVSIIQDVQEHLLQLV